MNLESHLRELPLELAGDFGRLVCQLRTMREVEPSAGLVERVVAAVEREEQVVESGRRGVPAPWGWAVAAAAVVMLLLGVQHYLGRLARGGGVPPVGVGESGVNWLVQSQGSDGSWSPAEHGGEAVYRPALTALATLALAVQECGGYEEQVALGVGAILREQLADGSFGGEGRALYYNQALATYALAKLASGGWDVGSTLERAVGYIAMHQGAEGGWDYEEGSSGNAAVTSWQVQALVLAEKQGVERAGVALRKGLRWLRGQARESGAIAYHADSRRCSEGVTALAADALMVAGAEFEGLPELGRRAAATLRSRGDRPVDYYSDYARVAALTHSGSAQQADEIKRRVVESASLGVADQWEMVGGGVYRAAFAALTAAHF